MTMDGLVIGGGLFGCHAALHLAKRGKKIVLVELESELIQRASIVNQARLHAGYHYPRSIATASSSDRYVERFRREFKHCINEDFVHYYGIARRGSLTDAEQFRHFCDYLGLPCEAVENHPAFEYGQLEAVFATREHSFDPLLLSETYRERIAEQPNISVMTGTSVKRVMPIPEIIDGERRLQSNEPSGGQLSPAEARLPNYDPGYFEVLLQKDGESLRLDTPLVVNATYSSVNSVHRQFGISPIPLQHEIAEMAFVKADKEFGDKALTVMDGPFCSLMPYGKTGWHSLSSVAYTHQRVSYAPEPEFSCQSDRPDCSPELTANCSNCSFRPRSNYAKMLSQLRRYLSPNVGLTYAHSRFTIKAKLQANHIDDGRPTAVRIMRRNPDFVTLFAGKVNSIYAMEEVLNKL